MKVKGVSISDNRLRKKIEWLSWGMDVKTVVNYAYDSTIQEETNANF